MGRVEMFPHLDAVWWVAFNVIQHVDLDLHPQGQIRVFGYKIVFCLYFCAVDGEWFFHINVSHDGTLLIV